MHLDGDLAGRLPVVIVAAMRDGRKSSKIYIPHSQDEGCNIVGILEQLDAGGDTRGRPIALVRCSFHVAWAPGLSASLFSGSPWCHGVLASFLSCA